MAKKKSERMLLISLTDMLDWQNIYLCSIGLFVSQFFIIMKRKKGIKEEFFPLSPIFKSQIPDSASRLFPYQSKNMIWAHVVVNVS